MLPYSINRMRYHPPTPEQRVTYERINDAFIQLAEELVTLLPDSADATVAMRQVEMARMYCNAAVALSNEQPLR